MLGWISSLVTLGAIVIAVVSLAAAVLRKWPLALRTAKIASGLGFGMVAFALVTVVLLVVAPRFAVTLILRVASDADPAEKATMLAMVIAELMNSSVLAVPVLMLTVPIWIIAHKRLRATASSAAASG